MEETNISGATSITYTPVDDDVGKTIKVRASFTDDAGFDEERTSAATAAVATTTTPAIVSENFVEVDEAAGTATSLGVKLSKAPLTVLTVSITSSDTGAVTVTPSSLIFTPANWDQEQQFDIRPVQDSDSDDESVTLMLSGTGLSSKTVLVTVRDDDNTPPFFSAAATVRSVAENTAANVNIGEPVTAMDLDGDSLTYALEGTDAASFAIDGSTGRIKTKAPLDYERKTSYSVTVRVDDAKGGSDTIMVTIVVTDVAERSAPVNNAPSFPAAATERSVAENTAANVNIGEPVSATDADGDSLIYTLEGTDAASFAIDGSTGRIRTKEGVDYDHETKAVYSVTVRVEDGGGGSDTIVVTIDVTDVAERTATPAAPLVEAMANSSLEVNWTKPARGGGPDVTGYEVQYRLGSGGGWMDWAHRGAGTRTRITRLKAGTVYEVRVRALNGETPSEWSEPARGSTAEGLGHPARAWLGRSSREVAEHVTEAIGERMRARSGSRVVLGGKSLLLGGAAEREAVNSRLTEALLKSADERFLRGEDAPLPQVGEISMPELLLGSSFHLASAENPAREARWSVWGRGAKSSFDTAQDALSLDGEVVTAMLGLDFEWERSLIGMTFSRSIGEGSFRMGGTCRYGCAGEVNDTMMGVHPYLRYEWSNDLSAWGVLGHGRGEMTLTRRGEPDVEANTEMKMAAFGGRGVVLAPSYRGDFELALRSDVLFVSASSEAVGDVMDAGVDTSRIRLLLEGSREYGFGAGGFLTPSVEVGLRYDAGDAEKGSGLDVGGALRYLQPSIGLTVEVKARGLLTHEEDSFEKWGMSASMRLDPGEDGRGLSMRLGSTWGVPSSSGAEQLWARRSMAGLARGADLRDASLGAEVGYGFVAPRGVLTPYTGVALSENGETWRAGARWKLGSAFDVSLEATLKEPAGDDEPESGLALRGSKRW